MKPLGEIAEIIRGVSFKKGDASNEPLEDYVPILRAGNIQQQLETDHDLVFVPDSFVSDGQYMQAGDVAIYMSSGSAAIVGKTAILDHEWAGSVGAFCAIVRFGKGVLPHFGGYWFRSALFTSWRIANAKGANIQNLRRADLEHAMLPVPPLAEQERIVKLLDEADAIRKLRARADQRTADLIPALFYKMFGDPVKNPMGWPVERLDRIAETSSGGTPNRKNPAYFGPGYAWVRSGELYQVLVTCTEESITESGLRHSSARLLPVGTILVAMYGATVGAVSELGVEAATNQAICSIRVHNGVNNMFLRHAIQLQTSSLLKQRVGGAQPNISQTIIRALPVPLPPIAFQSAFAQQVSKVHEMKATTERGRNLSDKLINSLLHCAFARKS